MCLCLNPMYVSQRAIIDRLFNWFARLLLITIVIACLSTLVKQELVHQNVARLLTLLTTISVFHIPSAIQWEVWKDFFLGEKALSAGAYDKAKKHFTLFQHTLEDRPAIKHLIWLYRLPGIECLESETLKGIGTACIGLGELEKAEFHLQRALGLWPTSAFTFFSLSLLAAYRNDRNSTEHFLDKAIHYGHFAMSVEQVFDIAVVMQSSAEREQLSR